MDNKLQEIIGTSLENIRSMIDANTVIGDPISTENGVTIVPVSKVTVFTCSTPIFGTILTILLLPGESTSVNPINLVITLILVSSGILLLNFKKQTK